MTIAIAKPPSARPALANRCWVSSPDASISTSARTTIENGGRNVESTQPRRGKVSHNARNTMIEMLLRKRRANAYVRYPASGRAGVVSVESVLMG